MAAVGLLGLTLTSCDNSFIFEDMPECVPEYRLRLAYDYNMQKVNAVNQVRAAEVYAFDGEGNLATVSKANEQELAANDWTLPLDVQRGQNYDLVVWCGLVDESPFALDGTRAVTSKEDLTCRLITETDDQGRVISRKSMPHLFHTSAQVGYTVENGLEEHTVNLIKNTNTFRVMIEKEGGGEMEIGDYDIEITDFNGVMNHQNEVSGEQIVYLPIDQQVFEPTEATEDAPATPYLLAADFNHARLMTGSDARLRIEKANSTIVVCDEPLIPMLLNVKEQAAPEMGDQEYLDREDTYEIKVIAPSDEDWSNVLIYINGWRVVLNNMEWK